MADEHRRYMLGETAISAIINVVFSALLMFLIFGRVSQIDLWGAHGLALDFVPQTFMITLMGVLVPSWITRRRLQAGLVAPPTAQKARRLRLPRNLLLRAVLIGCVLTIVLGGVATLVLAQVWRGPAAFWHVFPYKLAYGAVVAMIATPVGLHAVLTQPERRAIQ